MWVFAACLLTEADSTEKHKIGQLLKCLEGEPETIVKLTKRRRLFNIPAILYDAIFNLLSVIYSDYLQFIMNLSMLLMSSLKKK